MRKHLLSIILLFTASFIYAQPYYKWAKNLGGVSSDIAYSVTVDASGNVYTTGYFQGTSDFDPGSGTANLTAVGGQDIFVSKFDASGNFVWAKSMGGTSDEIGYYITVDASGNVYTTGYFPVRQILTPVQEQPILPLLAVMIFLFRN
jgi:hypothetical protein